MTYKTTTAKTRIKRAIGLCALVATLGAHYAQTAYASSLQLDSSYDNVIDSGIKPKVLQMALNAYNWANMQGRVHKRIITIVDFTKESIDNRLWVVDLSQKRVLFAGLVAHGKNSGELNARAFSNDNSSLESSLGAFVTTNTYYGKHGYSLRIAGLERGLNNNAAARAIVVHPAPYVSQAFINATGELGHSWGCFALDPSTSRQVINKIQGGSLIFAYAPQLDRDPHYGLRES